jgi:type IV pilus assembly protein PilX
MPRQVISPSQSRQQGATLIVALVILVLIMMLGIAAINSSKVQFKLAGNLQFEEVAMNSAETALATGEQWLATAGNISNEGFTTYASATAHLHPVGHLSGLSAPANDPLTMAWDGTSDIQVGNTNQRYMIELKSLKNRLQGSSLAQGQQKSTTCNEVNTYLITARGRATRGATKFIQSYYSVLNC